MSDDGPTALSGGAVAGVDPVSNLAQGLAPMEEATDLPDLFAGLARTVVSALQADACLVSVYDHATDRLSDVAASVVPPARLHSVAEQYSLDDFPATRSVIDTGWPIQISSSDPEADRAERSFLREIGFSRVLMSRFSLEGVVGTLETFRLIDVPFQPADLERVEVLISFARNIHGRIQLASRLEANYTETIEALVSALEARDPYTQEHAGRIRDTTMALSVALQVPLEERRSVRLGAILHDVGKIGVADSILRKPGPLTESEWILMRAHPVIGEHMLRGIDFLNPALPVVRHHHERWDGRGYPDGLAGGEIPIGARIVAVCDAFDAMTSDRPYRPRMSTAAACEQLARGAGAQFDPDCAGLLVEVVSKLGDDRLAERFVRYAS
ncbi:MAG TPA: HD-GYP domain-containing protein [Actinomycetota bacterium]|nr:HD-GYP domain-containing protein [Actinomycetota bacterium]